MSVCVCLCAAKPDKPCKHPQHRYVLRKTNIVLALLKNLNRGRQAQKQRVPMQHNHEAKTEAAFPCSCDPLAGPRLDRTAWVRVDGRFWRPEYDTGGPAGGVPTAVNLVALAPAHPLNLRVRQSGLAAGCPLQAT